MSVASLPAKSLHRSRGQQLITIAGVTRPMGTTDLSLNINVTDQDVFSNETYGKTLLDSDVDDMTFELTSTYYQVSRFALMMATLSDYHAVAQNAAPAQEIDFDISAGELPIVVPLGLRKTKDHVVEDANGVEFLEGVHFIVHGGDRSLAFVSIIAKPNGAANTGTITFAADAAKAVRFNIGERSAVEAKVEYLEAVKPGSDMSPAYWCFHRVLFRPEGDIQLIGDSADPRGLTVKGKCVADTTKPTGLQIGFLETFVEAA